MKNRFSLGALRAVARDGLWGEPHRDRRWQGADAAKAGQALNRETSDPRRLGTAAGKGMKVGAEDVDKWFKEIGQGIQDVGKKL